MLLAEHLMQGPDVWPNTPRRAWEAVAKGYLFPVPVRLDGLTPDKVLV